jgi:hypothetical protein
VKVYLSLKLYNSWIFLLSTLVLQVADKFM